ncbi:MAG: hypothetical protein KDD37_00570 [Bdellovibrionales bacterium]|nr:hypothetical protein [Bdellovibrionales bacterium]
MQIGEVVKVKVIEVMADDSLILSFDGKLLRVVNKTGSTYRPDDFVSLQVSKVWPLEFKLLRSKIV